MEKLFETYYWLQIGYFVLLTMIVIIFVYVFLDKFFCKVFEKDYMFKFENEKILVDNEKKIIIDIKEITGIKIFEKFSFLPPKSLISYYSIKIQTIGSIYIFNTQKQLDQIIIKNTKALLKCLRNCRSKTKYLKKMEMY